MKVVCASLHILRISYTCNLQLVTGFVSCMFHTLYIKDLLRMVMSVCVYMNHCQAPHVEISPKRFTVSHNNY